MHLAHHGLGVVALVHHVRAGHAVEAAGEERPRHELLVAGLAAVLVHGLVVRRHRDVHVVVLEVHAADLRVEVVARVADEPPRESVRRPNTTVGAGAGAGGGLPCGAMRMEPLFFRIPLDDAI
jgi:hypothetical protein